MKLPVASYGVSKRNYAIAKTRLRLKATPRFAWPFIPPASWSVFRRRRIDTPGHARGPKSITASVEADLNPGVLDTRHNFWSLLHRRLRCSRSSPATIQCFRSNTPWKAKETLCVFATPIGFWVCPWLRKYCISEVSTSTYAHDLYQSQSSQASRRAYFAAASA